MKSKKRLTIIVILYNGQFFFSWNASGWTSCILLFIIIENKTCKSPLLFYIVQFKNGLREC